MKKRQIKITILSLLVVFTIALFTYPSTNSKYKTWGDIKYEAAFYNLYTGKIEMSLSKNSPSDMIEAPIEKVSYINLNLNIGQNNNIKDAIKEGEEDIYTLLMPNNACTITSVAGPAKQYNDSFIFDKDAPDDAKIDVEIKCTISKDTESLFIKDNKIDINIPISEKIGSLNGFIYADAHYGNDIDTYNKEVQPPKVEQTITLPENESLYTKFTKWVNNISKELCKDETHIEKMVNYILRDKNFINEKAFNSYLETIKLKENLEDESLKGLNIKYNATAKEFTFTAKNNLEGYALYTLNNIKFHMFFTTENSKEIEEAWNYYLEKKFNADEINILKSHIETTGGITACILNNNCPSGFTFNKTTHRLTIRNTIFEDLDRVLGDSPIEVPYSGRIAMLKKVTDEIEFKYGININSITGLPASVIKNNNDKYPEKIEFNDYFAYKLPNGTYLLIEVYSDNLNNRNLVRTDILTLPNEFDIAFNYDNTNKTAKITMSSAYIEDIESIHLALNKYFNKNIIFDETKYSDNTYVYNLENTGHVVINEETEKQPENTNNNEEIKETE